MPYECGSSCYYCCGQSMTMQSRTAGTGLCAPYACTTPKRYLANRPDKSSLREMSYTTSVRIKSCVVFVWAAIHAEQEKHAVFVRMLSRRCFQCASHGQECVRSERHADSSFWVICSHNVVQSAYTASDSISITHGSDPQIATVAQMLHHASCMTKRLGTVSLEIATGRFA